MLSAQDQNPDPATPESLVLAAGSLRLWHGMALSASNQKPMQSGARRKGRRQHCGAGTPQLWGKLLDMGFRNSDEPGENSVEEPQVHASFKATLSAMGSKDASALRQLCARVGFGRGHLIEVILGTPRRATGPSQPHELVEYLLQQQLGPRVVNAWVGSIESAPMGGMGVLKVLQPAPSGGFMTLDGVAARIVAGIRALRAGLPDCPCHERFGSQPWVMFELDPTLQGIIEGSDAIPQRDLVTATTWMPEMLHSLLRGDPFYSGRFSRHREHFCYVELDDSRRSEHERLSRRHHLEDCLNAALSSAKLGCVVGSGIGLARSYIDLAIIDPARSVRLVGSVTRQESADQACLRPADSEHAAEAIPLTRRNPRTADGNGA